MSKEAPTLVIFLRHLGCVYCRESLAELYRLRDEIEAKGVQIALVHMGSEFQARELLKGFELDEIETFSDPDRRLYEAFGLERTTVRRLLAPNNLFDMLRTGVTSDVALRRSVGRVVGDVLQMPGVFLFKNGRIVGDFRPERPGERADYLEMAAMEC